ncbi:helix-turn-helix domain-containing protein [Croceiramulus getboli]|nr:AraC family transcriptional regulator [Flavobacteriaceae bacterium YJPT1-3]
MNSHYVKSLPIQEVLGDLAEAFQAQVDHQCGECVLELPGHIGEGYIRGTNFKQGLGLIEYNCKFYEATALHFSVNQVHPLKFIFCNKGTLEHTFEEKEGANIIKRYQNILIASSRYNGHILRFPRNKHIHLNSLEVDRAKFYDDYNCSIDYLDEDLQQVFLDRDAKRLFYYQGNYSLVTADVIVDMNATSDSGFLRAVKLESKALEMLAVQIEQFRDDLKAENSQQILRKADIRRIKEAVEIIKQDLADIKSVKSLSRRVGLNTNKLQQGFKHQYNETVNNFIQKERLSKAQNLLQDSEYSISEITHKVGFSNPSYLSKLFKERYGISPKEFRTGLVREASK